MNHSWSFSTTPTTQKIGTVLAHHGMVEESHTNDHDNNNGWGFWSPSETCRLTMVAVILPRLLLSSRAVTVALTSRGGNTGNMSMGTNPISLAVTAAELVAIKGWCLSGRRSGEEMEGSADRDKATGHQVATEEQWGKGGMFHSTQASPANMTPSSTTWGPPSSRATVGANKNQHLQ